MLLIDEDLESRSLLSELKNAGIDFLQVKNAVWEGASDDEVIGFARKEKLIIVTNNGRDFNRRLLNQNADLPSVIWTRTRQELSDEEIVAGIKSILEEVNRQSLERFVAIISPQKTRIRKLPTT